MFDLYHSIHRVAHRVGDVTVPVPCVLPHSELFYVLAGGGAGRLLVPVEALSIMGWHLDSLLDMPMRRAETGKRRRLGSSEAEFSWSDVMGLAGNAFSGFSCLPVAVASVLLLADLCGDPENSSP